MISKAFTVYDSKAEAYLPPFFLATRGQAIRAFADSANDQNHAFFRHPEDYTLFMIGEYDDETAKYIEFQAKLSIGLALEFKHPVDIDLTTTPKPMTLPLEGRNPNGS